MPMAQVFGINCASCHGTTRRGGEGPALTPAALSRNSLAQVANKVNHEGRLTPAQIPLMADFLKNTPP